MYAPFSRTEWGDVLSGAFNGRCLVHVPRRYFLAAFWADQIVLQLLAVCWGRCHLTVSAAETAAAQA